MKERNIVLFADGTGNQGGYTPSSNVYKIYNAIELRGDDQITFYDNGVGTASNKYWRGLSGAVGFGFKRNVRDLYEYLARNYEPGDNVFIFGFSRGAATVRAFSGLLACCGLVDGRKLSHDDLEDRSKEAVKIYKDSKGNPSRGNPSFGEHGVIPIKFIGVWDTVTALGFPEEGNYPGIGMWVLDLLLKGLSWFSDLLIPHRFYNYELTDNVEYAYQALAIDDERKSFLPLVWDENKSSTKVEQVWFSGAHSNVGGGYKRAGLADVALDWMMARADKCGLNFKKDAAEEVHRDENVHGRLYNSRDGGAIYFRYQPRDIKKLCRGKLLGKVKIHRSVLERMKRKSGNYAPGHLPYEFNLVDSPFDSPTEPVTAADTESIWQACREKVNRWVFWRKWCYVLFLEFTLLVVISAVVFWNKGIKKFEVDALQELLKICSENNPDDKYLNCAKIVEHLEKLSVPEPAWTLDWLLGHIADVLYYVLPSLFEGLVTVAVIDNPSYFGLAVLFLFLLWIARIRCVDKNVKACEAARKTIVETDAKPKEKSGSGEGKESNDLSLE